MSFAFGIQAIHPSDASHILGHASARTGATDLLFDVWNGSTSAARVFALQKDGRLEMKDGTAAAPVLTFLGDLDSGLYRIGANNLGVALNGAKVLDVGTATTAVTGNLTASGNLTGGGSLTISGALSGVTTIAASGVISGGATWNGTAVGVAYGGTGLTSYTAGDLLYATSSTTLAKLGIGTANRILTSSGSAPQWSENLTVGGTLAVTGATTLTGALTGGTANFAGALKGGNDGSGTVSLDALDIVAGKENAADHGMTIVTSANAEARIHFSDGTNGVMEILAQHSTDTLRFGTAAALSSMIWDGSRLFLKDTANSGQTIGLTINQSTNADEIAAFKSSSVAHGVTSYGETDTFGSFRRLSSTSGFGGLEVRGMNGGNNGDTGVRITALGNDGSGVKSTAAKGIVEINCAENDGAGAAGGVTANENLLVVRNLTNAKFLVDADGDIHFDGTSNAGAWDAHDDVGLLSTLRSATMGDGPQAREWFGEWVGHEGNRRVLEETGIVTFNDDGHHFVSMKGLQALVIDAIRQTNERWQSAISELVAVNGLTPGPQVRALMEG